MKYSPVSVHGIYCGTVLYTNMTTVTHRLLRIWYEETFEEPFSESFFI